MIQFDHTVEFSIGGMMMVRIKLISQKFSNSRLFFSKKTIFQIVFILFLLCTCSCSPEANFIRFKTPTPSQPMSSAYEISAFTMKLLPADDGQGIPEAAAYNPDLPGPHRIYIISLSDSNEYDETKYWNISIPPGWLATSINDTELVVVVKQREVDLGSQQYTGQITSVKRVQYILEVKVVAARSGTTLASTVLEGSLPSGFPQVTNTSKISGDHVSFDSLVNWLREENFAPWARYITTIEGASITFSPDSRKLAVVYHSDAGYTIDLLQAEDYSLLFEKTSSNGFLAFSSDSNKWYSNDEGGLISYQTQDGSMIEKVSIPENIVEISPDGQLGVAIGDNLNLYRLSDGTLLYTLEGQKFRFSPDGKLIATLGQDRNVRIWQLSDGTLLQTIEIDIRYAYYEFSPNNEILVFSPTDGYATSSLGHAVSIWNVQDGSLRYALGRDQEYPTEEYIAISPNGESLASCLSWKGVYLTNMTNGDLQHILQHDGRVSGFRFSPNNEILVTWEFERNDLYLWRVADGSLLQILTGHEDYITGARFSPDSQILATKSRDGDLILWDLKNMW
jgi:hypothetical protein